MARLSTLALAISLANSAYAQVLAGDSAAAATATVVATAQVTAVVGDGDDQDDATVFSILQDTATTTASAAVLPVAQAAQASAAASVVSIYFPGADPLPYVASLIGEGNGVQTLAVTCAAGVNSDTCGFPSSVTVTAGPSTAYVSVSNQEATFIYDCKITGSTAAVCTETFNGDAAYIITKSVSKSPGSTSSVLTESLVSTDITWMPITITAGGKGVVNPSTAATPNPTSPGSAGPQASQSSYPDGGAAWAALGSLGSGSSSASSGSNPGWVPGASSTASQATPATDTAGTANTAAWSTKTGGLWPATYTGAAAKVGAFGNYAAGLVALAGLAL